MKIDPKLIDVIIPEDGYPEAQRLLDTRDVMMGAARDAGAIVTEFPAHLWIEPKDWGDASRLAVKYRTRAIDYRDRFTNQGSGNGGYSTHECTTHCFVACFEMAWNRQRRIPIGPPVAGKRLDMSAHSSSVWFSCLSLYAEANPGEWGGAGVRQILNIAARRGMLPDKIQPRDYGFKHMLHGTCGAGGINQSRGNWTPLPQFPDGWQEGTAKHFRPLEYIFPSTWEQHVCLLIHGRAVGVGREGHSVPHAFWDDENKVAGYLDSYDIVRYDSINRIKKTVGSSYAIESTTTPDDWDHPAGV